MSSMSHNQTKGWGSDVILQDDMPSYVEELIREPKKILNRRIVLINKRSVAQFGEMEGVA